MPSRRNPGAKNRHHRPRRSSTPETENAAKVILAALFAQPDAARKLAYEAWQNDVYKQCGISKAEAKALTPEQFEARVRKLPRSEFERLAATGLSLVPPAERPALIDHIKAEINEILEDPERLTAIMKDAAESLNNEHLAAELSPSISAPSRVIERHEKPENVGRQMREQQDKSFIQDGVRWFPLSIAAPIAQAPETTLRDWIKNETEFNGQPLQSYYFAPVNRYFLSEESIRRVATRFIKWRAGKPAGPAGPVTLGETDDRSGFIGLPEAREILGISNRTMYLWATQKDKAPIDEPLDVIKCTGSGHFYIREKDVYDLKKLIPKRGLHRGRRPQLALQH